MEAIDIGGEGGSGEKETSMAPLRGARKEYSLAPCHHLFVRVSALSGGGVAHGCVAYGLSGAGKWCFWLCGGDG